MRGGKRHRDRNHAIRAGTDGAYPLEVGIEPPPVGATLAANDRHDRQPAAGLS